MRDRSRQPRHGSALEKLAAAGFTLTIIDTKGEDTFAQRGPMELADLCLIPIRPAGPDLHASHRTMEALRSMGRDFAVVVNQASPNKAAKITSTVHARPRMARHDPKAIVLSRTAMPEFR